jgi:transposase-like protein
MEIEKVKRYSQAFKQQVVREYESGSSINQLRQRYGIGGHHTVKQWIKQYSRAGYRGGMVVIQSIEDQENLKGLKRRVAELESALAESVLENRMLQTTVTVASQALGIDIKKNFGKPS